MYAGNIQKYILKYVVMWEMWWLLLKWSLLYKLDGIFKQNTKVKQFIFITNLLKILFPVGFINLKELIFDKSVKKFVKMKEVLQYVAST